MKLLFRNPVIIYLVAEHIIVYYNSIIGSDYLSRQRTGAIT